MDIQERLFKESLKKSLDILNCPDPTRTQLGFIIDAGKSPAEIFEKVAEYFTASSIVWH